MPAMMRRVTERLAGDAPDTALIKLAAAEARVIVSKDADFVALGRQAAVPVQLLWVRLGNCGNRALVDRLLAVLPQLLQALASGTPVVELR